MSAPDLLTQAEDTLRRNHMDGYTAPSPRLYPHQWNWDSAFIAIAWAHLDWEMAVREVDTLLEGQWRDGFLPHIRYNPKVREGYQPGPDWWPDIPVRVSGQHTSGITQPPVLPTAVFLAGLAQPDERVRRSWWRRVFAPLRDLILCYPRTRTAPGSPLMAIVHPWESGTDNSPRWDFATGGGFKPSRPFRRADTQVVAAAQRPTDRDYDLYYFLVELIADHRYDFSRYLPHTPFAVYDALFNAIWYRGAVDLNRIAAELGEPAVISVEDLRAFADAYRRTLWHESSQLFRDFNLKTRAQIPVDTVVGLGAICGGLVDRTMAEAMISGYLRRCRGYRLLPSVLPDQPGFEPDRYWRGPVWVNTNWLIIRGLQELGLTTYADALSQETLALVHRNGRREFYHARSGEGLGGTDFSWTAALVVDLLRRPVS
ncbi:MAG: glycoside hydrolase [Bacillati bacterium ANGP1]|uniref:Glycoside hydrolase n=1 Tax=Candidatus Segetimicrobium genomatis TaxID=2569760 RepID=A0A537J080_9BACT|nr:MAG: glycoside hydrolase [Terrabacteria group bacterium ANGP1]